MDDNILPFPGSRVESISERDWKIFQAEFYLDCYLAAKGQPASDPDDLESWILESRIRAEIDNAFFRGWLVRRLSETQTG